MDEKQNEELVNETRASEEVVENSEQTKTYSQEEVDAIIAENNRNNQKAWDKRWGQEKSKMKRQFEKERELSELLRSQTDAKDIDELLDISYQQYGKERPSNSKDEEILGKNDAKEILELDMESIESEANRLASKKRNAREEATFLELGNFLTTKKAEAKRKEEIKEAGIDEATLNNEGFKEYMSKFREDTPIKFIYDSYSKINSKESKKEKPFSAGSLKGSNKEDGNAIKEFYTYEESLQFTKEDFDRNPKLFEAVERSMQRWGK